MEKEKKSPVIGLSDRYLKFVVEAGKTYEGRFFVFSENGVELEGTILSTNDKVVPVKTRLSGTECEIPFYFKGKLAIPGEEHVGDFLLITNGGEWNLPYCIQVIPKKMRVAGREIGTLEEFSRFAKEDWKGAKEVFFTREFKEVFLQENKKNLALYHGLAKGRSRDLILDHFLQGTTGKEPLLFELTEELVIKTKGWGYAEGRIYSENGNFLLDRENFSSADFVDGQMTIQVTPKEDCPGKDRLILETAFQKIVVPLEWKKEKRQMAGQKREKKNRLFPGLLRDYIDLRTGALSIEEYAKRSQTRILDEGEGQESLFLDLCQFQIQIVRHEGQPEGSDEETYHAFGQKIEKKREQYLKNPQCRNYYYYLMTLYKKDHASLMEAELQIRDSFQKNQNFHDFWLLLLVNRRYAMDRKLQCQKFAEYAGQGENSPLLYLEWLDALNQNPYYLEDLEDNHAALISWGIRHSYLSLELSRQFARLTMKEKFFRKNLLDLLIRLYEIRQDESYLLSICSMLIKGNKTDKKYHIYFEQALALGLKIVGINEYYLRSLDFHSYPILPKSLLLYFNYSNSLDAREKAYLYNNILHYEKQYDYVYASYLSRMEEFVREQMMEGRMNRYLQHLYEYFLPEILKDEAMIAYLPNIIFKKKLTVESPCITGVYICHDEIEEEIYVPVVNGVCQIETYSERVSLYFADARENRYRSGIQYTLSRYLNENQYMEICLAHNLENKKVLLKWSRILDEDGEKNERIANMVLETGGMKNWMREKAVEQILNYHYEEKEMEDLNRCLDQINYRVIRPSYRRTLMNYYMACNRMEDAYFGIELYGSDLVNPKQLYLLTCVGLYLHKEEKDDLLLIMAQRTFFNGRYNDEILSYLRNYLEGRMFDLLALWEVLKKKELDTVEYEERLLRQMAFTGERDGRMFDVLLSYLEKTENDPLASSMLDLYSADYFLGKIKVPESYFEILDQQVAKKSPLSRMTRLVYLSEKAKTEVGEQEQKEIGRFLDEMCQKSIAFPFFEQFDSFYSIPSILREMTFFVWQTKEAEEIALTITDSQGKTRLETVSMEEISPGYYFGTAYLLLDETFSIRPDHLEEGEIQGENAKRPEKKIETFHLGKAVRGSRRSLLQQMEEQKQKAGLLRAEYERVLERMDEELFILYER